LSDSIFITPLFYRSILIEVYNDLIYLPLGPRRNSFSIALYDIGVSAANSVINPATILLELLDTHLGFTFPKVIPCLLFIISHYLVSYILGENIPPGEYSLSVDTLV